MAPYEALYGRKCQTPLCWTKLDESKILGLELVQETKGRVKLIKDRLRATSDRQKYYADKTKDIEYCVGDQVFLKVFLWRKVLRFERKGKLSPRKYRSDPSYVVWVEEIEVRSDLSFEEEPMKILDHEIKVMRKKSNTFGQGSMVESWF
ncbi:uncharacterized protein [Gossypium hirsutum]|uniref:Reverse transcriptase domain-containing protein n=1 Tax=Gossypium hirsutum TaxID=3635 RepID=A0ABM3BBX7_GOSHI|nr:uncharacterized protein LOC121224942 [Gossypium hirsutum]